MSPRLGRTRYGAFSWLSYLIGHSADVKALTKRRNAANREDYIDQHDVVRGILQFEADSGASVAGLHNFRQRCAIPVLCVDIYVISGIYAKSVVIWVLNGNTIGSSSLSFVALAHGADDNDL